MKRNTGAWFVFVVIGAAFGWDLRKPFNVLV